ncbi:RrF2 family transcriptional regulator [Zongyangia hominis]|uniref:Rrf2 family transcriptional regulator n=1 Tax=Zongyangia hominis TaxID=2763677 RepID=A0A926E8R2_9FIRM|nr:Rrf2 family transcriptional regulator [Zongyangia hominis]MBC8569392.1 Rrf2 family transcriptional regulator [Zongyangia hominis]
MHITLESDYATRIVYCLAKSPGRMDAKSIAETTGVTLRFSLKILRKLVASGIIKSFKGTQGGYELAKEPKDISLCDIIETVEGPLQINRCVGEDFVCTRKKTKPCQFQQTFREVSEIVCDRLRKETLDQYLTDDEL